MNCQGLDEPSESEWDECVRHFRALRLGPTGVKVLVLTEGGGPNSDQRRRLAQLMQGSPVPFAIVSDSLKTRFVAAALALVNRQYRSFSCGEIEQAYEFLGLTSLEKRLAESAVRELKALLR